MSRNYFDNFKTFWIFIYFYFGGRCLIVAGIKGKWMLLQANNGMMDTLRCRGPKFFFFFQAENTQDLSPAATQWMQHLDVLGWGP